MMGQGIQLMLVGMGTVFAFLGLMVAMMTASARFFEVYGDRFETLPTPEPVAVLEDDVAIAIAIAVAARRSEKG